MRLIAISFLVLMPLVTACVGSVQPVYTEADLVYDASLLGAWRDSGLTATRASVTAAKSSAYAIAFTDEDGKEGHFTAHLARVGEMTLLDVEPEALAETLSETYRDHFVSLHSFFFVKQGKDRVVLTLLELDKLNDFLQAQPGAVPHFVHDHDVVFTGEPRVIQAFLASYWQRPGVLGDSMVWRRPQ